MTEGIRQLCGLSVFCGLALSIAPEGSVKKVAEICCTVLLLLSALSLAQSFDLSVYSVEMARYRELGTALAGQADESRERLSRLVIEEECEEYILNRAARIGLRELEVSVTAQWDADGFWVPKSVVLRGEAEEPERRELEELIWADLGIGRDRQEWVEDEG